MSKYSVGISINEIIEAEDKLDAKTKFFKSLSWKECYASEIEPYASEIETQAESEDKERANDTVKFRNAKDL